MHFLAMALKGLSSSRGQKDEADAVRQGHHQDGQLPSFLGKVNTSKVTNEKNGKYHVTNFIGTFLEGSEKDVPSDLLLQYLDTVQRVLQCYQKLMVNNLPVQYYNAPHLHGRFT